MSQQPPPPPYGGPPDGPPGPYPPSPYGGHQGEPPRDRSNKWKFWIGVVLTLPALIAGSLVTGAGAALVDAVGGDPAVGAPLSGVLGLAVLAGFVVLVVLARTRWIALGILAGTALLFILAAGACVALLVAYSNSYG